MNELAFDTRSSTLPALIAAKIIRILDDRKLSTRDAERLTGVSDSVFTRIRGTQLCRFTLDRMIAILGKLDANVEVSVTLRPRRHGSRHATYTNRHTGGSWYPVATVDPDFRRGGEKVDRRLGVSARGNSRKLGPAPLTLPSPPVGGAKWDDRGLESFLNQFEE
ncbi:MAG: XRE family transcriptional regulator [Stellaceae bacterium]